MCEWERDCPIPVKVPDGTKCEIRGALCASGQCTSRSMQCAAIGTRLGLTEECPYDKGSCSVVCKRGSGCVILDAKFIDGTPCGYSGKCHDGVCSEASYKTFAIRNALPLGLVAAAIMLWLAFFIVTNCISCGRRRTLRNQAGQTSLPLTPNF